MLDLRLRHRLLCTLILGCSGCSAIDVSVGAYEPPQAPPAAPPAVTRYLEAEEALELSGFSIEHDATASAEKMLMAPANAQSDREPGPARARYRFRVDRSASYVLWGRIRAPNASNNRFWFKLDDGPWIKWRISTGDIWFWDDLHEDTSYADALQFALEPGEHELLLADAVSGVALDKLYITADGDTPPGNDTPCRPPHSIEVAGVCLPSCGAQMGRMCGVMACAGKPQIEAYDCDVCCTQP